MTPELRALASKLNNPIGRTPRPAASEIFDLVRRYRELSADDRDFMRTALVMLERQAERQAQQP